MTFSFFFYSSWGQLRAVLDEFQSAIDLIMTKHRAQISALRQRQSASQIEVTGALESERERAMRLEAEVVRLTAKVHEMQAVMQLAMELDAENDRAYIAEKEVARLKSENEGLREMLGIAGLPAPGFEDEELRPLHDEEAEPDE